MDVFMVSNNVGEIIKVKKPKFEIGQTVLAGNQKFIIIDIQYSAYKNRYIYVCKRNDIMYIFKEGEIKQWKKKNKLKSKKI